MTFIVRSLSRDMESAVQEPWKHTVIVSGDSKFSSDMNPNLQPGGNVEGCRASRRVAASIVWSLPLGLMLEFEKQVATHHVHRHGDQLNAVESCLAKKHHT